MKDSKTPICSFSSLQKRETNDDIMPSPLNTRSLLWLSMKLTKLIGFTIESAMKVVE